MNCLLKNDWWTLFSLSQASRRKMRRLVFHLFKVKAQMEEKSWNGKRVGVQSLMVYRRIVWMLVYALPPERQTTTKEFFQRCIWSNETHVLNQGEKDSCFSKSKKGFVFSQEKHSLTSASNEKRVWSKSENAAEKEKERDDRREKRHKKRCTKLYTEQTW